MGARSGLLAATAALLALGACSGAGSGRVDDSDVFRPSETSTASTPATPPAAAESAATALPELPAPGPPQPTGVDGAARRLPEELTGVWTSAEESAALRYRFVAEGGYAHAGVLLQEVMEGTFRFAVTESGSVRLRGRRLTMTPLRASQSMRDPADPANDFDKPGRLEVSVFTWMVDGDQLTLTDPEGSVVTYRRQ